MPASIDFGDSDYVTTEVACQVMDGENVERTIIFTIKLLTNSDIDIVDNIMNDGTLYVENPESGATYVWQRSEDGENWETVNEKRYDLDIVTENGTKVNVAKDLGGGMYYRVKKTGTED